MYNLSNLKPQSSRIYSRKKKSSVIYSGADIDLYGEWGHVGGGHKSRNLIAKEFISKMHKQFLQVNEKRTNNSA